MLSMGVALLVAAMVATSAMSATRSHSAAGGTEHIGLSSPVTFLDPQLAYDTGSWTVLENTEVTLLRYSDSNGAHAPLKLEGAASFPSITHSGKWYTWHIKPGFQFNTGAPVDADSYARAFERLLSPCMFEGGIGTADFFDKLIVGAAAFNQADCSGGPPTSVPHISGVQASGNTLSVHLTHPAAYFTAAMAMIWFSATPASAPYDNNHQDDGAAVAYASAGPYYVDDANPNQPVSITLKQNPNYSGSRASNPSQMQFIVESDQTTCYNDTKAGNIDVDLCGLTATLAASAISDFGASTVTGVPGPAAGGNTQFHVESTDCIDYMTLDTQAAPTNLLSVRKALEYALDRGGMLSILGAYAGAFSDQVLTPPVPGYKKYTIFPVHPDYNKAASLASGDLNGKTINIWYNTDSGARRNQSQGVKDVLDNFSSAKGLNLTVKRDPVAGATYYVELGNHNEATNGGSGHDAFNIARAGWCADYYDPFDYLNVLFNGQSIQPAGNNDLSYVNIAGLNSALNAASAKTGAARKTAYAALDKNVMTKYAPVVSYELDNARIVVSSRVGNWTYDEFQGSPALNVLTVN
jgi:peptide/nickel transport system substrate-binding protein